MRTAIRNRSVCQIALVASLGALQGCGPSLGPSVYQDLAKHGSTSYGVHAGLRTYPADSQGLLLGGGAALAASSCCTHWRANADVGYGRLPLAHASAVGIEAVVQPGAGRWHVNESEMRTSLAWGWQVALPIRISASKLPWQEDSKAEPLHVLVPAVTLTHLLPVGKGEHDLHNELGVSLTYRFHLWPAMKP